MATYLAIQSVSTALSVLLTNANKRLQGPAIFPGADFKTIRMSDLNGKPVKLGITICFYRVSFGTSRRNLPPRHDLIKDRRYRPPTPVDLHFLFTPWGEKPEDQQQILAWTIRTLHETPMLSAGLINSYVEREIFRPDEAVELVAESLTPAELASVWEVAKANQQPSISFTARMVLIDSEEELPGAGHVQTRVFDYHEREKLEAVIHNEPR